MATIDEALVSLLEASSAVAALAGDRIYPLFAKQTAARPHVVYQRISSSREYSHCGPSALARPRFQFRCVAATYAQARQLAAAVRETLDGFRGVVLDVDIQGIINQNELDEDEVAADGQATSYSTLIDFFVWHGE